MTFEQAREQHLKRLETELQVLKEIVSDPQWCNEDFPEYKRAIANIVFRTKRIRELNTAQIEAV